MGVLIRVLLPCVRITKIFRSGSPQRENQYIGSKVKHINKVTKISSNVLSWCLFFLVWGA
jgi:hypothetical protein